MMLASFQMMTAEEGEAVRKWDELTLNKANANLPTKELAGRILAVGEIHNRVFKRFTAEQQQLYTEIKAFEKQLK